MKQEKLENLFDYLPKSKIKAGEGLEEGAYPFYTSSETQSKYLNDFQHAPGCLVFGTGGKANVHLTTNCFSTSTDCITIKPKSTAAIDASYVFQYFKGNMQILENGFKGAGLKHISKAYLSEIKIPHPENINDQIRIAHLLGKVEGLIAKRKHHLQQLDDLLKSVFLEMFGDPVRNEKGWDVQPLGKLTVIERGRFSPRPRNDPKFFNGAYPFIQTGDINRSDGRLQYYTQTLNDLGIKVSKEFDIGTIVIAIVGATIGETAILQIPVYAPDSVIGITCKSKEEKTQSVFIEFLLRFWKPVLKARAPEAARANINIETLRPIPVIWPDEPERKKFATIVEKVEALKSIYQKSLNDLESLYGALSQQAFKGELDLSRVPLSDENKKLKSDENTQKNIQITIPLADFFQIPAAAQTADVTTKESRSDLLKLLLSAWVTQYSQKPFVLDDFVATAQNQFWKLTDGEYQLGSEDYDTIKSWVFDALDTDKLRQRLDETNNKIRLGKGKPA